MMMRTNDWVQAMLGCWDCAANHIFDRLEVLFVNDQQSLWPQCNFSAQLVVCEVAGEERIFCGGAGADQGRASGRP